MAPPIPTFPASELPSQINTLSNGKPRKPPIDLEQCEKKEMVQYKCNIKPEKGQKPLVICEPVVRLFRQCADGMLVETTAWERLQERKAEDRGL